MSQTRHPRGVATRAVVGTLALLLAGCGSSAEQQAPRAGQVDPERSYEVAGDPEATADEIIEFGRPARLAFAGDEAVLVSYVVDSEDDEGPQAAAWRLYDGEGAAIAEGKGSRVREDSALPELWDLDDGVLMQPSYSKPRWQFVTTAGEVEDVPLVGAPTPTRPGDIALGMPYFFRPSDSPGDSPSGGVVHRLPDLRAIGSEVFETDIDPAGGVWATPNRAGDQVQVAFSPDGTAPWIEVPLSVPRATYPEAVQTSGDVLFVSLQGGEMGDRLAGLAVRDPAAPPTETWRMVPLDGIEAEEWFGPSAVVMADGRLLLGEIGPSWYIGTDQGAWERVSLAEDAVGAVRERDGVLYDLSADGGALKVSEDGGATWASRPRQ